MFVPVVDIAGFSYVPVENRLTGSADYVTFSDPPENHRGLETLASEIPDLFIDLMPEDDLGGHLADFYASLGRTASNLAADLAALARRYDDDARLKYLDAATWLVREDLLCGALHAASGAALLTDGELFDFERTREVIRVTYDIPIADQRDPSREVGQHRFARAYVIKSRTVERLSPRIALERWIVKPGPVEPIGVSFD